MTDYCNSESLFDQSHWETRNEGPGAVEDKHAKCCAQDLCWFAGGSSLNLIPNKCVDVHLVYLRIGTI